MGAIDRSGFSFEPEYSVMLQRGAIHVYQNGDFVEEIPFTFSGMQPEQEQIELLIEQFLSKHNFE